MKHLARLAINIAPSIERHEVSYGLRRAASTAAAAQENATRGTSASASSSANSQTAPLSRRRGQRQRLRFDAFEQEHMTLKESMQRIAAEREASKEAQRKEALENASLDVLPFSKELERRGKGKLLRTSASTMQINIGKLCNLTCRHCHVESGPTKIQENMGAREVERCLELLSNSPGIDTVDITGGAPELNPYFRRLVQGARALNKHVIDRCNLVVLFEKHQHDLAKFLADHQVHIVASLPCYTEDNTDKQRGKRVHQDSVDAIRTLNEHGYGVEGTSLRLDLVYNPGGPFLPPPQRQLEADYRSVLRDEHGIVFDGLFAISNMPIKRFADDLQNSNQLGSYVKTLASAFNEATVDGVMCRNTVNVAWDGRIYDCDFNAALGMQTEGEPTIWNQDSLDDLTGLRIRTGKHCYGCTAGSGSSCGGTLV